MMIHEIEFVGGHRCGEVAPYCGMAPPTLGVPASARPLLRRPPSREVVEEELAHPPGECRYMLDRIEPVQRAGGEWVLRGVYRHYW